MMVADLSPVGDDRPSQLALAADVTLGAAAVAGSAAWSVVRGVRQAAHVAGRLLPGAPDLPEALTTAPVVTALAERGRTVRTSAVAEADRLVRSVAPAVVLAVLDELDLTALVAERVDLNAVAEGIDVDAVVARADLDAVIDRVDIERILARVDLDAVVARVDIARILARVDLDAVVERVDIRRILARVDIDSIAARLDLDPIIARIDLLGLADYVVNGIDLPGIIRESSGSMASEVVRGVRLQSLDADEAVSRVVNRFLPGRRGARPGSPPGTTWPDSAVPAPREPDGRHEEP